MNDEQFIRAMHAAVEEQGRSHCFKYTGPNTYGGSAVYQTPSGEGACLIGYALLLADKRACPAYGVIATARGVLTPLGISNAVVEAASAAQFLQDIGTAWGKALDVFDWIIQNWDAAKRHAGRPDVLAREANMALMKERTERATAQFEALKKECDSLTASLTALLAEKPAVKSGFASGGVITGKPINITVYAGDPIPFVFGHFTMPPSLTLVGA